MVPPDDNEHGCAWRDFAKYLQGQVEALTAKVEVLQHAFTKRSEKRKKMPKVPRPPRTPKEVADRRIQQALLRAENVVTEEKVTPVPERLSEFLCNLRSAGGETVGE